MSISHREIQEGSSKFKGEGHTREPFFMSLLRTVLFYHIVRGVNSVEKGLKSLYKLVQTYLCKVRQETSMP